jgi:hypothetical protein
MRESIPGISLALIRASVTGLEKSIPFAYPLAGNMLLYGIGAWPSPDGVREDRSANLQMRAQWHIPDDGLT